MPTPNRLAEIRAAAGMSQAALARELNIDKSTIWRWEQGKRKISDDTKLRLAALFGVSVAHLMGWPEQPTDRDAA
jgi:transcriptional regulator with XRE-family HTH domain